jgi:fucose 4-O-acetylase-like acetyltransferase
MPQVQLPKRDATWDIARGIGMMLVIYGHLLEPIYPAHNGRPMVEAAADQWQVIYSFHMMLFFLMSGAVNRSLPNKAWPDVLRGSLRLLALAWVVHVLGVLFPVIVNFLGQFVPIHTGIALESPQSIKDFAIALFAPILEGYKWSVGVLWFLTSLCFVQILAYFLLRHVSALTVALAAIFATVASPYVPHQYLMNTWTPGLAFFALGYQFSQWQVRWPFWAATPLIAALIFIAPLNHGCTFSFEEACGIVPFSVRMFMGNYGFLPIFFLSSLVGSLAVVCLSAGLAKLRASSVVAYMGRKSLELFFINGFVATFLFGFFWQLEWPHLTVFHYIGLFIGIVAAHLIALQILAPVLAWINAAGLAIAGFLTRLLTDGASVTPRKA